MKFLRSLILLLAAVGLSTHAGAQVSSTTGAAAPVICTVAQNIALTCSPKLVGLRIVIVDGATPLECGNAGDVGLGTDENFCAWSNVAVAWIADEVGVAAALLIVEVDDSVVEAAATTMDFLGVDFDVTSSPAGEANVAIDASIARDSELNSGNHTIASHSDTTATGAELETLTDGSNADALHAHADPALLSDIGDVTTPSLADFQFLIRDQTTDSDWENVLLSGDVDNVALNGAVTLTDGASTRINLGLEIGADVQAWDNDLDVIAGLVSITGQIIISVGNNWAVTPSPFLDCSNCSASTEAADDSSTQIANTAFVQQELGNDLTFALLAGRPGGQTLIGGTATGDDLNFETTSFATKGNYNFAEDVSGTLRGCDTDAERLQIATGGNLSCETHAPPAHTIASHSDTTATGAELETLTDGSNADALHAHAVGSHTIASHSDTTATGSELETLTDGSNADALHLHALMAALIVQVDDSTVEGAADTMDFLGADFDVTSSPSGEANVSIDNAIERTADSLSRTGINDMTGQICQGTAGNCAVFNWSITPLGVATFKGRVEADSFDLFTGSGTSMDFGFNNVAPIFFQFNSDAGVALIDNGFSSQEKASGESSFGGFGEFYVRSGTPNIPAFRDEGGSEFALLVIADHDTTATGAELDTLTDGSNADALHAHAVGSHTIASHSDTTATGAELETLTDGSNADALHAHAVGSHTIASHSDTTATGAELDTLTGGSDASSLHTHTLDTIADPNGDTSILFTNTEDFILTRIFTSQSGPVLEIQATKSAGTGVIQGMLIRVDNESAGGSMDGLEINLEPSGSDRAYAAGVRVVHREDVGALAAGVIVTSENTGPITVGADLSHADIVAALAIGANTVTTSASTILASEFDLIFLGAGIDNADSQHSHGGTAPLIVQVDDSTVEGAAATMDFLGADFDVTSSPAGEANVAIDASIARDSELNSGNHTIAAHSDTTATGAELETLTDGSNADALHAHAVGSHTIASHSDTTATGAELDTLTGGSDASSLHTHTLDSIADPAGDTSILFTDTEDFILTRIFTSTSASVLRIDATKSAGTGDIEGLLISADNESAGGSVDGLEINLEPSGGDFGYASGVRVVHQEDVGALAAGLLVTSANSGPITVGADLSHADIVVALAIGANTVTTSASTILASEFDTVFLGAGVDNADAQHSHAVGSHTIASHSDTTATGAELETLTDGSNADALHAHAVGSHTIASHSDTTATGAELETLTDGSNADALHAHVSPSHTIASHSDTTATGAELDTLTDASDASALHNHTTANLNDTTATGGNLNTLVGGGDADSLHTHDLKANLTSPVFLTSLALPQGASPVVDAAGELAWDTTAMPAVDGEGSLRVHDGGSAGLAIPAVQQACAKIPDLAQADDNFALWSPLFAITIKAAFCECHGTCTTEADIHFEKDSGGSITDIGGASPTGDVLCEDTTTGGSLTDLSSGTLTLAALDTLRIDTVNALTPEDDDYVICWSYTVDPV